MGMGVCACWEPVEAGLAGLAGFSEPIPELPSRYAKQRPLLEATHQTGEP